MEYLLKEGEDLPVTVGVVLLVRLSDIARLLGVPYRPSDFHYTGVHYKCDMLTCPFHSWKFFELAFV